MLDGRGLKLGTFSANCSSRMAATKIEDRWKATWHDNLRPAKVCDATEIHFMLPIARWIGHGGDTGFHMGVSSPRLR